MRLIHFLNYPAMDQRKSESKVTKEFLAALKRDLTKTVQPLSKPQDTPPAVLIPPPPVMGMKYSPMQMPSKNQLQSKQQKQPSKYQPKSPQNFPRATFAPRPDESKRISIPEKPALTRLSKEPNLDFREINKESKRQIPKDNGRPITPKPIQKQQSPRFPDRSDRKCQTKYQSKPPDRPKEPQTYFPPQPIHQADNLKQPHSSYSAQNNQYQYPVMQVPYFYFPYQQAQYPYQQSQYPYPAPQFQPYNPSVYMPYQQQPSQPNYPPNPTFTSPSQYQQSPNNSSPSPGGYGYPSPSTHGSPHIPHFGQPVQHQAKKLYQPHGYTNQKHFNQRQFRQMQKLYETNGLGNRQSVPSAPQDRYFGRNQYRGLNKTLQKDQRNYTPDPSFNKLSNYCRECGNAKSSAGCQFCRRTAIRQRSIISLGTRPNNIHTEPAGFAPPWRDKEPRMNSPTIGPVRKVAGGYQGSGSKGLRNFYPQYPPSGRKTDRKY